MALTPRQKKFADLYIKLGNATEAARQAGYNAKSARQMGTENLTKPSISAYIAKRMVKQDAQRVASADEVLEFYTSVMRGEKKDQFGLDSSLADRLKAADSLMKRWNMVEDKKQTVPQEQDDPLSASLKALAAKLEGKEDGAE